MKEKELKNLAEELKLKKEKERKAITRESLKREKDKYYSFYSDVKTSARDNGEW